MDTRDFTHLNMADETKMSPYDSGHRINMTWNIRTGAIVLLLGWLCFMTVIHSVKKRRQKQRSAEHFEAFLLAHGASRTPTRIPYSFLSSWQNKLSMLLHRDGDLLGRAFGEKFRTYGATHALYDAYDIPKVVHTIDSANVHAVLSSQSQDFGIPDARLSAIGPIKSKGVVMTEGVVWQQNRRIINVGFRGARLTADIEKNLQIMFDAVLQETDNHGWTKPFHLFDSMAFMSLDRSIRHMFGVRADLQAESGAAMKQRIRWKEAFDTIGDYVAVRSVLGKKSWMYDGFSFRGACGMLRELCRSVIRTAIVESKSGTTKDASFVGNLVQETADVQRICDVTLDVFIAGHNMTAGVLTWLFLELEQRPEVYDDVREEVLDTFGTVDQPKLEMNWDNLQKCKKLHNCIYEAMRLHPTLPNIGRQAIRDTILPTGGGVDGKQPLAIAKGTVVMACLYLMHRTEQWGAEPDAYLPERWTDRNPGHEYAPFGGGPRICPGQLFALVEMYYVVARVMQRFQGLRQTGHRIKVGGSGAGVLIPPEVSLALQASA